MAARRALHIHTSLLHRGRRSHAGVAAALVLSPALLLPSNSPQRLPPPTMVAAAGSDPAALPPPLAASDGVHTFTYDSVQRRLPLIVEAVIDNNPSYSAELVAALRELGAEMAAGAPLKPLASTQCGWPELLQPHLDAGATVHGAVVPRRELPVQAGARADRRAERRRRPLRRAEGGVARGVGRRSQDALCRRGVRARAAVMTRCRATSPTRLRRRRAVAPADASAGGAGGASMLLADDTAALCALEAAAGKPVTVVLDYRGLELVSDLLLVDGLAAGGGPVARHPPREGRARLRLRRARTTSSSRSRGSRSPRSSPRAPPPRVARRAGRLPPNGRAVVLHGEPRLWEMLLLRAFYRDQALVITKGDANYRRLLGDRHWAHDTDFAELMGYWPCALRPARASQRPRRHRAHAEAAAAAAHPTSGSPPASTGWCSFGRSD